MSARSHLSGGKSFLLFVTIVILWILSSCEGRYPGNEAGMHVAPVEPENTGSLKNSSLPFIGAQIFIEPGQTEDEIFSRFRLMSENNLSVCRIRMFESYMRDEEFNWDFTLFDYAFKAADEYDIKIWATLYPVTGDNINIGGEKFPDTEEKLASIARYIEKTVNHFKSYKSLAGWVLINEPGVGGTAPDNAFAELRFAEWEKGKKFPTHTEKGYSILMDFKNEEFLLYYNTWFLKWIADEIKKFDPSHDFHVNNHNIFVNCAEYNFPEWRSFLTSMGGSAHASWHFRYFSRDKYAVAMSADCEMVLSGAGDLPWFMTEVQGGNNTYSSFNPMCPTREEIFQWLWIVLGTEGKGAIFWTLNPRASGIEAGEWGMIDFQDKPTDRILAAKKVGDIIDNNAELFSIAKKAESHISILYSRESLWAEKQMAIYENEYEGRNPGGVMKSVLAWFEAFGEMGISPDLKAMNEFNYAKDDYSGHTIVLSHQLSLPSFYADSLEHFVARGGKLIVDGLTAYFDENMHNTMLTGFDFQDLFGGNVSEFKFQEDVFGLNLDGNILPAHLWKGFVTTGSGMPLINEDLEKVGIRNQYKDGEVLWVPSLMGLGSRIRDDFSPLQQFIQLEAGQSLGAEMARFGDPHKKMLMKTLQAGNDLITIIVNKNDQPQKVQIIFKEDGFSPEILFPDPAESLNGNFIVLLPEETKVILWKQAQKIQ